MRENQDLWDRFIRLGDMMGDGLHNEPDGRWISREYKKISKILIPELKETEKKRRLRKATAVNEAMSKKLEVDCCNKCKSKLKQVRSGSFVVKCINDECGTKYKYSAKKK